MYRSFRRALREMYFTDIADRVVQRPLPTFDAVFLSFFLGFIQKDKYGLWEAYRQLYPAR
jgi:hypothetical protein